MKNKISITLSDSIIKRVDSLVDRIFIRNRSQAVEVILRRGLERDKKAVVLLGGDEKRLRIGKEWLPEIKIKGVYFIEKMLIKLRESNFRTVFIVARKFILDKIFSIIKNGENYGVKIVYVEDNDSGGSADSLRLLRRKITDSFLVVFGDIIMDKLNLLHIWEKHLRGNFLCTLMLSTFKDPSKKGVVELEGNKIIKFIQKPKKSENYLVFSPVFVCEPELLNYSGKSLEEDVFPILSEKGLLGGFVSSSSEIHIHTKKDLLKVK